MFLQIPWKKNRATFAAIFANISYFAFGTCVGWTSPIIPKLRDHTHDSPLSTQLTNAEEGWISSNISIGALVISLVAGQISDKIGKRSTLLFCVILIEVSYIVLLLATEIWMFLAARFIQGIAGGILSVAIPMYVGEIAPCDMRGALGTLSSFFNAAGALYVFCIGPYVSYMTLQLSCLAIPIVFFSTFIFMPETPYDLAKNTHNVDLLKFLQYLRGHDGKDIEIEADNIQASVESDAQKQVSHFDIFRNRGCLRALLICCGLLIFQQFSGSTTVTYNSQSIFASVESIALDPSIATIILGSIRLFSSLITPFIVERTGRKKILIFSALGMSISLFSLGIFFYIQKFGDSSGLTWIPIPALFIFNFAYSFGFGPVPWAVVGEIFPSNVKPMGSSIACVVCWISTFLVTRWFPELNALGPYYLFFMFGTLMVVSIPFNIFYVIETKGLTIEEIQKKLIS